MEHELKNIAQSALSTLAEMGAERAQCTVRTSETREFNMDGGEFSLMRTLFDRLLSLTAYKDSRRGIVRTNSLAPDAIERAAADCLSAAASADPDDAWELAPGAPAQSFTRGPLEPDLDLLFERTRELAETVAERYPKIMIEQMIVSHECSRSIWASSLGSEYEINSGEYKVYMMFSAHEGELSSSFFGSGFSTYTLDRPFIECASLAEDLANVERQISTVAFEGKCEGTLILPPSCLGEFLYYALDNFAGDSAMLDGTAIWRNSLGQTVADPRLTVSIAPLDARIVRGSVLTGEGYLSENYDVIRHGVLESFMLSAYVANKTGQKRALNSSFSIVIEAGDTPIDEIVRNTENGIIVGRFSGGSPSSNGDFSGVAKNSFIVRDGKIVGAASETMISGNLADMLKNLVAISDTTVCDGSSVLPTIAFGGITISGK